MSETEVVDYKQLMEDGKPPLRELDVVQFLRDRGRDTKCPFCPHDGGWNMHLKFDDEVNEPNPRLSIFRIPLEATNTEDHTSVALTCPRCGHFSLISTFIIRLYLRDKEKACG